MTPKIAITGATGYVGGCIARYCVAQGAVVTRLGRSNADVPYRIGDHLDPEVLKGYDVLIHAAYDFKLRSWEDIERINVQGSIRLFRAAQEAKVHIVMISTTSAFPGAESMYGKAKLMIEREALKCHGTVIRAGLVFGPHSGGAVGTLRKISRFPVVPLINGGRQKWHPCHEDDLASMVWYVVRKQPRGIIPAASEKTVTIKQILQSFPGRRIYLPIPYVLAYAGVRILEILQLGRFRSDGLKGMVKHTADYSNVDFSETRKSGIPFRPFS